MRGRPGAWALSAGAVSVAPTQRFLRCWDDVVGLCGHDTAPACGGRCEAGPGRQKWGAARAGSVLVALELTLDLLVVWVFPAGDLMVMKCGGPSLLLWRLPVAK